MQADPLIVRPSCALDASLPFCRRKHICMLSSDGLRCLQRSIRSGRDWRPLEHRCVTPLSSPFANLRPHVHTQIHAAPGDYICTPDRVNDCSLKHPSVHIYGALQAQPANPRHDPAANSNSLPPLLWRSNSPSNSAEPDLCRAADPGTGSAKVDYRSVNKLHNVASPAKKLVNGQHRNTALGHTRTAQPSQAGNEAAASASQPQAVLHPVDSVPAAQKTADPQPTAYPQQSGGQPHNSVIAQQAVSSMQALSSKGVVVSESSIPNIHPLPSQPLFPPSSSTSHMHQWHPTQSQVETSLSTPHMQQPPSQPSAALSPDNPQVHQRLAGPSQAKGSPRTSRMQESPAEPSSAAVSPKKPHVQAQSPSCRLTTRMRRSPDEPLATVSPGKAHVQKLQAEADTQHSPVGPSDAESPNKSPMQKAQEHTQNHKNNRRRHTPEGWQARLGCGRSRSKQALGTFATGMPQLKRSCALWKCALLLLPLYTLDL